MARRTNKTLVHSGKNAAATVPRGVQAYRFLRDAIESNRLTPGTRLVELDLADELKMSRTPIREALGRLEADGLIINEPGYGLMVTELDHGMVSELYVVREVLEGTAARLAARHASEIEIALLAQIADADRNYIADPVKLAKNNKFFHEALYQSAHNRHLLRMLKSLHGALTVLGQTTLAVPGRAELSCEEHQMIVRALQERDPDRAEKLARTHIQGAFKARMTIMVSQHEETIGK